jgi:hypothetical protein
VCKHVVACLSETINKQHGFVLNRCLHNNDLQKRQNGLHLSEEDEGEIISMPDCASFRESNVNALVASLLALPTYVHLLILISSEQWYEEQSFFHFHGRGYSCATARDLHTVPY